MTPNEYLQRILSNQKLDYDGREMKALEKHRDDVSALLLERFKASNPTIKFAGSRAKGTMNKDGYDLDIVCYFDSGDDCAGSTLEEIFYNVAKALKGEYNIELKTSAIRIMGWQKEDFHIDVVPGRFSDDTNHDAFLYVKSKEKGRQKTNLKKHIQHIKNSGVVETIRLAKLWNVREGLGLKTFVLELLVVKALQHMSDNAGLDKCISTFWKYLRDHRESLCVEDPANPYGNDLSNYIDGIRDQLSDAAEQSLDLAIEGKWESIYGSTDILSRTARVEILNRTVYSQTDAAKPWLNSQQRPGS